jgi:DNA-binding MarR family transcriptional regulator
MTSYDQMISPKKMKSILDSQMNKVLKEVGFTASQVPFILEIGVNEGISMKELSIFLGADKGLTAKVVHSLIKNGLVENRSESSRKYRLFFTRKGKEAYVLSKTTLDNILSKVFEIGRAHV